MICLIVTLDEREKAFSSMTRYSLFKCPCKLFYLNTYLLDQYHCVNIGSKIKRGVYKHQQHCEQTLKGETDTEIPIDCSV